MEVQCATQDVELSHVIEKHRGWACWIERQYSFLCADDLLQETAFRVMQRLRADDGVQSVDAFFNTVLCNVLRDALKRKRAVSFSSWSGGIPDCTSASGLSPLIILEREEHRRALHECISQLSPDDAKILTQRYLLSWSISAIAEAWGIRVDAIHMRLSRARDRLGELLSVRGLAPGAGT